MPVIEVEHLHKQYRDQVAVDDLSFTVERGEIFGVLGPNGPARPPRWRSSRACALPTAAPSGCSASTRRPTVATSSPASA